VGKLAHRGIDTLCSRGSLHVLHERNAVNLVEGGNVGVVLMIQKTSPIDDASLGGGGLGEILQTPALSGGGGGGPQEEED